MEEMDEIDVLRNQAGMISNWTTTDVGDALTTYLMFDDEHRAGATPPMDLLRNKHTQQRAPVSKSFEVRQTGETTHAPHARHEPHAPHARSVHACARNAPPCTHTRNARARARRFSLHNSGGDAWTF